LCTHYAAIGHSSATDIRHDDGRPTWQLDDVIYLSK
jgi:hypothetical protein